MARGLHDGEGCGVDLFEGVLVVGAVHHDQRFAQSGGHAGIKRRVPLFVFVAKAHYDDIGCQSQSKKGPSRGVKLVH